jgi:hypothetical protein
MNVVVSGTHEYVFELQLCVWVRFFQRNCVGEWHTCRICSSVPSDVNFFIDWCPFARTLVETFVKFHTAILRWQRIVCVWTKVLFTGLRVSSVVKIKIVSQWVVTVCSLMTSLWYKQPNVKLHAAYFSETFVPSYQTTYHHDPQDRSMHIIFLSLIIHSFIWSYIKSIQM